MTKVDLEIEEVLREQFEYLLSCQSDERFETLVAILMEPFEVVRYDGKKAVIRYKGKVESG